MRLFEIKIPVLGAEVMIALNLKHTGPAKKTCEKFNEGKFKYCFLCNSYPCSRLRYLDKRYKTKYSMSMIDNLNSIKILQLSNSLEMKRQDGVVLNAVG